MGQSFFTGKMKNPTANFKSPGYDEQHILFVGAHTGSFKRIDVSQENAFVQKNLEDLSTLTKGCGITALELLDSEILLGREDGTIKRFSLGSFTFNTNIKSDSKITGLCSFSNHTIAAHENGKIVYFKRSKAADEVELCGNISRMRQCKDQLNLVAVGGKDRNNNLKIVDLSTKKTIFTSKNIPNDELDLEVPVWDTDMGFLSPKAVATCSRYGYVRVYDTSKQRRPVQNYKNDKEQISYTAMATTDQLIFVGSNLGVIRAFDCRSMKTPVHTYKGFVGSVTSLSVGESGKHLTAGGLDRYVRVYDVESSKMQFQCYAKSKVTQVLLQEVKEEKETEDEEVSEKRKYEVDPEYEQLFENMEVVRDEDTETRKKKKV